MARIADSEIERIKAEVSLVRLVESSGLALAKRGKDELAGLCPFHADDTPSLSVSVSKNLFHCFGCDAAGGPIDWVMKREGMSFRHAVEWLRDGAPVAPGPEGAKPRHSGRRLPSPVKLDADDAALLAQVIDYYHDSLKQSPEALAYLAARGLDGSLVERFRLGYANRTLGLRLPEKNRKAGAAIRGQLEKIGIYRASGHEHFTGSLVVPVIDEAGRICEIYGRKIRNDLRPGTPLHLYLPGPHAGVWNIEGVAGARGEVILAESLIDAMTFWSAGYRNVTAAYGAGGFTDDHLAAFRRYGVERVLIAFDRDDAGDKGADAVADRLMAAGIAVFRIVFPKGMDANAYAVKVTPAAKSLGVLIRKAQWLGNGKPPAITSAADPLATAIRDDVPEPAPLTISAAEPKATVGQSEPVEPPPPMAAAVPSAPVPDPVEMQSDQELVMVLADRRYRVRGWKKPLNPESLKVNLLVSRNASDDDDDGDGRFHVDTLDLYAAKARAAFAKQAGIELGESEDALKHDLGRILLRIEVLQDAELAGVLAKDERTGLSEAERAEAMALLTAPDLTERILADFAACGMVGEETNALTGYLACVSRLLDRPLALIIQSSSAAGKSSLMDAVLGLMPGDAQVRYSAMTGQSLFYMGETNLKHRILAIAEEEGASQASYALKLLQSEGEVTIASTGKDATTGNLVTQEYRVEGPVMLFLTTTAIDIDEELMNRCMVLTVDESREQTRAIHVLQRRRQTLAGLLANEDRQSVLALHRNAQTLLEPVRVVNPFADALTFLDDKTRTRRDHMKYLTLIQAIALLHQHQRPVREVQHRGNPVRYIEVIESDIALANRLAHEVLGRTLDELPPQTRRLLGMVHAWASAECERLHIKRSELRFTRRQIRAVTGWGDTQLKVHLGRLAELEYLLAHRGAPGPSGGVGGFHYELLYDGDGDTDTPLMMGLSAAPYRVEEGFPYDPVRSGSGPVRSPLGRAMVGPRSGGGRGSKMAAERDESVTPSTPETTPPEMHVIGKNGAVLSYPHHTNGSGVLPSSAAVI
ncbi:CHC2 zinc finger domain-containing protein [Flavobacterium sp.]|uniref:CHC2 zinc finger domain-containing protein n=1 Tax=Flavobacterium sp. TaxID=239 RepID=UPI0032656CF8